MELNLKIYIFMPLSDARNAPLTNEIKTFKEALYWHFPWALQTVGRVFLQGLFICPCFQTQHKGVTKTLQHIIGGCKGTISRILHDASNGLTGLTFIKWLCYKLLTTTETNTINDTTAELRLFPVSLKGDIGDSFTLTHPISLTLAAD